MVLLDYILASSAADGYCHVKNKAGTQFHQNSQITYMKTEDSLTIL